MASVMSVSVPRTRAAPAVTPPIAFIPPLIPTLVDEPPAGEGWTHEIKHDGYRVQIIVSRRSPRLHPQRLDWTARFGPVIDCAAGLRCTSAIIDGELFVQDERGLSDFHALRAAIGTRPEKLALFRGWAGGRANRAYPSSRSVGAGLSTIPSRKCSQRLRDLYEKKKPSRRYAGTAQSHL